MQAKESSEEEEEGDTTIIYPGFLAQAQVKDIMRQVLTGLAEMHGVGVWHRDVKVDNIMLDKDGVVKLIDFNISKNMDEGAEVDADSREVRHTKNVVTRNYRPPEIFFGDVKYRGDSVDAWSAGCVLAELLTNDGYLFPASSDIEQLCKIFETLGTPTVEDWPEVESLPNYLPFNPQQAKDLTTVIQERRQKQKSDAETNEVDPQAIDLLSQLLALNPSKRLLPRQALAHPYFTSAN